MQTQQSELLRPRFLARRLALALMFCVLSVAMFGCGSDTAPSSGEVVNDPAAAANMPGSGGNAPTGSGGPASSAPNDPAAAANNP